MIHDRDAMASYYNEWWENPKDPRGAIFAKLTALVGSRLPDGKGKKALDLGSGAGAVINELLKKGYSVTAIEYSKEAVEKLRKRFPGVTVVQADLNEWQPNEKYDIVTMMELTQNFTELQIITLLKKVRAVTSSLVINNANLNSLQGKWVTWRKFKAAFVYLYSVEQYEKMLTNSGFTIVHREGVGFLMPITLLSNFRFQLLPTRLCVLVNRLLDTRLYHLCALNYTEVK